MTENVEIKCDTGIEWMKCWMGWDGMEQEGVGYNVHLQHVFVNMSGTVSIRAFDM